MFVEKIIVLGLATLSLGTIREAEGVQEHAFWLRNAGDEEVALLQGYTSCGCTTIAFPRDSVLQPGDSVCVSLRFNPQGKGGEFYESGTIVYGSQRQRVVMALEGTCITSEETLLRQFPVRVSDQLRLSTDRFDLGIMQRGAKRELQVVVLHRDEDNRQERIPVVFSPAADAKTGLQHIRYPVTTRVQGREVTLHITLDVIIK